MNKVLVLNGPFATALLVAVWTGAAVGIVVEMIWVDAPKWVTALIYVAVGWIGALAFPAIVSNAASHRLGGTALLRSRRRVSRWSAWSIR